MHCRHLTKEGLCTGTYEGYACIKKHCAAFKDAQKCEFREVEGDYCKKYNRFGCVGKESCQNLADYLEAVAEEGH